MGHFSHIRATRGAIVAIAVLLAQAPGARAQPQLFLGSPHLGYAYPAGGRQGTAFEMALGGQNLSGASEVLFSGGGVATAVLGYERPMTQKEFRDLLDQAQQLAKRRQEALGISPPGQPQPATAPQNAAPAARPAWTPEEQRTLAQLRQKIETGNPNRLPNPAIAEAVRIRVTLAADATPGERELRLLSAAGLSNPLVFCVGQLPEYGEERAAAAVPPAAYDPAPPATAHRKPAMEVAIPAVLNGQLLPGAVDRFRFSAKKGQRLVAAVSARSLMPYLADAVPGWIQAALTLRDSKGREVAYSDAFRFNPDPVLSFIVPADGAYTVEINDAIYRGREDFVYRISLGELPFITGVYPLGGPAGRPTSVELTGWNLPQRTLVVEPGSRGPGIAQLSVSGNGIVSNKIPFGLDCLPETSDSGSGGTPSTAEPVALPVIVNGRIALAGAVEGVQVRGEGRPEDRRRSDGPPAGFADRFRAEPHRRLRPPTGLQR